MMMANLKNRVWLALKFNPLTWLIRKTVWRFGIDVCTFPNVALLLKECDLVIDAGANRGDSRHWIRSLGYRGRMVSYEPVPEMFEQLVSINDPLLERHKLCLSDVEEEVDFHVRSSNAFQLSGLQGNSEVGKIIRLKTNRLDKLLAEDPAKNIFLKVDCEGHDLAVVKGAQKLFPRVRTIIMEVSTRPRYEGELDFAAVVSEMKLLGFRVACSLGNQFTDNNQRAGALELIFERVAPVKKG